MIDRVLIAARCEGRGHVLAELLAGDPLRVRIPHGAYGHAKAGRIVNARGGPAVELLDPAMIYPAMCSCGVHPVSGGQLERAWRAGKKVVTVRLVLL